MVVRLLVGLGYENILLVGGSGDGGADVIATKTGRRWLFQVKRWSGLVGPKVVARTIEACKTYSADIPVIVSRTGFEASVFEAQLRLNRDGTPLQLWDRRRLIALVNRMPTAPLVTVATDRFAPRAYQETAVERVTSQWLDRPSSSALIVLATGLGKTFVAGDFVRRASGNRPRLRILVLAHRNELVYQLERSFWPFLRASQTTVVWNGFERPDPEALIHADSIFACIDSVDAGLSRGDFIGEFDVVIVDEAHHLGTEMYERVLDAVEAAQPGGPFLLGLTATPWRPDGTGLDHRFAGPLVSIDLVEGLTSGYLANVDYRMYTDNVDWDRLQALRGQRLTPRAINRTLFIDEWDDAVVERFRESWNELPSPRALVFCGTVDHADRMAARINALGFTRAAAIYARSSSGIAMPMIERSQLLWDFADQRLGALCAVDVLNEGVDLPDVNLIVFQRVTHSRRIFVQQLGRGLRLAPDKEKVIVLDFVSDVRRFAAGLDLQDSLRSGQRRGGAQRVRAGSRVTFLRANETDVDSAQFLREWIGDVKAVEDAGDDVSVLRFPPDDHRPSNRP
jgi:superfamily II DNA or RNA helicase